MKLNNWLSWSVLLGTLLAGGYLNTAVAAESTSKKSPSDFQIAQATQQSQAICRRIRPEAIPVVLAIYGQPSFRSTIVGQVNSGNRVFLASRRGIRGTDGLTYVQINNPVAGYIQAEYEGVDTLGSCNVRDTSIPALW